ncbi:MAG: hypothetical protein ACRC1H_17380, partial [Caldilineaceae bacterium]
LHPVGGEEHAGLQLPPQEGAHGERMGQRGDAGQLHGCLPLAIPPARPQVASAAAACSHAPYLPPPPTLTPPRRPTRRAPRPQSVKTLDSALQKRYDAEALMAGGDVDLKHLLDFLPYKKAWVVAAACCSSLTPAWAWG